ncbi:MAG TPA: hypothetical protein VFG54_19650, partial [Prolixibacteraceae bacterium]|nr:hypothetical protein [Prolixibacteraceae bacterium]
ENMSVDELKKGMEIQVTRFLEPMKGKLIQRKDTIIDQIVTSNFEFETGNAEGSKQGVGRFILKDNRFICFLLVAKKPEPESNKKLQDTFFNSIQIK